MLSELREIIKDLKQLRWDIHNNNYYDLEDELRYMNNIDKAILILKQKGEL